MVSLLSPPLAYHRQYLPSPVWSILPAPHVVHGARRRRRAASQSDRRAYLFASCGPEYIQYRTVVLYSIRVSWRRALPRPTAWDSGRPRSGRAGARSPAFRHDVQLPRLGLIREVTGGGKRMREATAREGWRRRAWWESMRPLRSVRRRRRVQPAARAHSEGSIRVSAPHWSGRGWRRAGR